MPLTSTPPGGRRFSVGRIGFLLDGIDLRYVTIDGVEMVRRVFAPVRDERWGTLEPAGATADVTERTEGIEIQAEAHHRSSAVDVTWKVVARASASGELSYAIELTPRKQFPYARMGICLLHPPEMLIGRDYLARTPGGEIAGRFESMIDPQRFEDGEFRPLVGAFSTLQIEQARGGPVSFDFEGDLFELEDQRNWSDGSFKTYCTPLRTPRPLWAEPGKTVRQRVQLAAPPRLATRRAHPPGGEPVRVEVGSDPSATVVPKIALALPTREPESLPADVIRATGLGYLRVDVREPKGAAELLGRAAEALPATGVGLIVALHVNEPGVLDPLLKALLPHAERVAWVLVFDPAAETSPSPLLTAAREWLARELPLVRVGGGSDRGFAELNRGPLDLEAMDGVAWPITPQVHGSDELTIVETLVGQADQVASARRFAAGLDLLVGPVTLRPRCQPSPADSLEPAARTPPSSIDPRQGDLFVAAWTAGSVARLAVAGASAATFFETHGPNGVLAAGGGVLPCWHPLADACAWSGSKVLPVACGEPLAVQVLAVRDRPGGGVGLLVANLRREATRIRLSGLPAGTARLRTLDAAARDHACADPHAFRARTAPRPVVDGELGLDLEGHAVATVLAEPRFPRSG